MKTKTVSVIGGGLGGLSAAIYLRSTGYEVDVFEKNSHLGGKLNVLKKDGFSFDLGPSIVTMPEIFEDVFRAAGEKMSDHLKLVRVEPQWRNFFEDDSVFDLYTDKKRMKAEFEKIGSPTGFAELEKFLIYTSKQYELVNKGYFKKGLDTLWSFLKFYGFFELAGKIDHRNSMSESIQNYFSHPKVVQVFEYFIKYVGSSALNSPGYMNLLPYIQFEQGLWYFDGGLFSLSKALQNVAEKIGVRFHVNSEVKSILREGKRVIGLELVNDKKVLSDKVLSNMEVIPTYKHLLGETGSYLKKLEKKFEPACSGIVLHLATNKRFEALAHHNFFYSRDQKKHFQSVFDKKLLPEDPTLYVVAPTRSDASQAPDGCDNIKILPHIPYLNDENPYTEADYLALKDKVIDKMERMGCPGLRESIIFEDFWTPFDIEKKYRSNKGSIYGVVTDWKKNYGFKAPKRSRLYKNLYFAGGSVNPGGGMPMVLLCGKNVAQEIVKDA